MKRAAFILIAVLLLFGGGFASAMLDGIKGVRTEDTTEAFSVTTVAGQTTANVTLGNDLFQDDEAEVISISSNISGESPVASSYTATSNKLLVAALNPSATHTLTVNYYADTESSVFYILGPFMGILLIGGLLYLIFKK